MGARLFRPKRLLTLALLAAAIAAAMWWAGHIPYDPAAIYRPIPATASVVGRHLALPDRWGELLENPLAEALMRTIGIDTNAAALLATDPESQRWFRKLAGQEVTLAFLPGRFGAAPAWLAVSQVGGQSQKLRWQLVLSRLPGYTRMKEFPGRSVWEVHSPDLAPEQRLAIAFGEGVIMACLSENRLAIAEALAGYDGNLPRLVDAEPSFAHFAEGDDRSVSDRFWIRDESPFAPAKAPGIVVDVPRLKRRSISLTAATAGAGWIPKDRPGSADFGPLARLLGDAPCAVAVAKRETLLPMLDKPWLDREARNALRLVAEVATDRVAAVFMDGDMGGRLAWGVMRKLGLAGLRVPTLVLATPVADEATAGTAIQRVLDASNARYKAAFMLRPVPTSAGTLYVLESAGGDEWVDDLAPADRPAYAVVDGWLLAASNFGALQKLAEGAAAHSGSAPAWAGQVDRSGAGTAWLDLARSGKLVRDGIATWSMAQVFLDSGASRASRAQLNEAKAWVDAFAPFGEGRAELSRRAGQTVLALDLGLSGAGAPE